MPGTKMMSPRGPTRFQLSLQHAVADCEGGSASVGQWIQFRNAELAGSIAGLGGDFVIIDCERGRISTAADLSLVVDAVAAAGASPIVRVLASEQKRIRWAQDCGAHGVMVAMCETKAQAERTVVATGCPSPRFVVIVEIDSRRAVENVDDMAAVPGIDALFVGPHPLISPGSDTDSVPIAASADAVLAAARRHAKFAGHFAADADAAAALVRRGWQFVNCGPTHHVLAKFAGHFAADADAAAALVRRGWQFVNCGPTHHVLAMQEEMARTAGEEMERLRRAMLGMRESPPPIEGKEYEWDGKDWG